jgi:hypothetical protein
MEWGPAQPTGEPVDRNLISWCQKEKVGAALAWGKVSTGTVFDPH